MIDDSGKSVEARFHSPKSLLEKTPRRNQFILMNFFEKMDDHLMFA